MPNKPSSRPTQPGRSLRWARVLVAAVVLTVLTLFFLDFAGFIPSQAVWLAKIQLIPSILAGAFGVFAALVLLTLIFGRVYCSVVCPLGIFQDVLAFFGRFFKSFANKPRKIRRDYAWIANPLKCRAGFLLLALATLPFGLPFLALLEPYGIFGRIAVSVLKPLYLLGNNLLASIANAQGSYAFVYVPASPENWASFGIGV
ncbi:MAG: 4Fe-4S binding protein, partial [Thermoguttaceae bacterium]|nr:4Fe-4S binding protein [Thermoguttaceae bacterium]